MVTTTQGQHSSERRLAEIGRRIDGLRQTVTDRERFHGRLNQELDIWRRWRDELAVQAELGTMDARDVLEPRVAQIELAFEHAVARIEGLLAGPEFDGDDFYAAVGLALSGLRREIDNAGADFDITE